MSIFSDIAEAGLNSLAQYAPTLATMIGGPLAGTAVTAIESVLGITPTGDANKALAAFEKRQACLGAKRIHLHVRELLLLDLFVGLVPLAEKARAKCADAAFSVRHC